MYLLEVAISHFMPFGKNILWKVAEGAILVNGKIDDTESSNESGKSSLLEAPYWCWTGDTVKSIPAADVVHLGFASTEVSTKCMFPDGIYIFKRVWSKSLKYVTITTPDGIVKTFHNSTDGTKAILEIIGLSADLLSLVAFFGKKFNTFSKLEPIDRANLIDILAKGAQWEEASQRSFQLGKRYKEKAQDVHDSLEPLLALREKAEKEIITVEQAIIERTAFVEKEIAQIKIDQRAIENQIQKQTEAEKLELKELAITEEMKKANVREKVTIQDATKQQRLEHTECSEAITELSNTVMDNSGQRKMLVKELEQLPTFMEYDELSEDELYDFQQDINIAVTKLQEELLAENPCLAQRSVVTLLETKVDKSTALMNTQNGIVNTLKQALPTEAPDNTTSACEYCGSKLVSDTRKQLLKTLQNKKSALCEAEEEHNLLIKQVMIEAAELQEAKNLLRQLQDKELTAITDLNDYKQHQRNLIQQARKLVLRKLIAKLEADNRTYDREIANWTELKNNLALQLLDTNDNLVLLDKRIAEHDEELIRLNTELRNLTTSIRLLTAENTALETSLLLFTNDKLLSTHKAHLLQAQTTKTNADTQLAPIEIKHKKLIKEYQKMVFWTKGFKAIRFTLMQTITAKLQIYVTAIAQNLGLRCEAVNISAWTETAKGTARPKITVTVVTPEGPLSLEASSEGAEQRINLAFFLAIGMLIEATLGVHIGFKAFDEPLAGLDEEGKIRVFNVITQLPGIEQVFITEHDSNFKDQFTESITVHNVNRFATVIQ